MKAKTVILVVVSLLFAGVLYTILGRKEEETHTRSAEELLPANNPVFGGCVSPPSFMRRYTESEGWWGECHRGLKNIGYSEADADEYVDECAGFFKAIDVEPTQNYVKYFEAEIREWVENGGGIHWKVDKGSYRCK